MSGAAAAGSIVLHAAGDQSAGDEVLAGAVVQVARDPPPLLVLRPQQRRRQLARRPLGAPQFVDQGAQQEDRDRKAHQEQLQREHAALGLLAGKQAGAVQGPPGQDHRRR